MAHEDPVKPHRIHLKGPFAMQEEGRAAATIKPGMLISLDSAGTLVPHPTAGGNCEKLFALEDALQGRTIDIDYTSGELVFYLKAEPGTEIYALMAPGEDAEIGEYLSSNGDGSLQVVASTEARLAVALENVDLSDSAEAANGRIKVRIL